MKFDPLNTPYQKRDLKPLNLMEHYQIALDSIDISNAIDKVEKTEGATLEKKYHCDSDM